jgi:hypothetical protein
VVETPVRDLTQILAVVEADEVVPVAAVETLAVETLVVETLAVETLAVAAEDAGRAAKRTMHRSAKMARSSW